MTREPLEKRIQAIAHPFVVRITAHNWQEPSVQATLDLVDTLATNSSMMRVVRQTAPIEGVEVTLVQDGQTFPVSFWGTPSGYEFESLVYAIERLIDKRPGTPFSPAERAMLSEMRQPLHVDLYVAPT